MPSSKASASDTQFTSKLRSLDSLLRTNLGGDPYPMSYSGADFTTLIHIPVAAAHNKHQIAVDEIEDEILELSNILRQLRIHRDRLISNSTTNLRLLQDIDNRATQLNKQIANLKKAQADIKTSKGNIIPLRLDSLQTLSVQIHVDKQPVRALGHSYPKGYCRGAKLVAGSMIFTVIREHPLIKVIDMFNAGREFMSVLPQFKDGDNTGYDMFPTSATIDHLPPMHVTVLGVNEAGNAVNMNLYGVEFINDGLVLSIQDMITESTINFVAQDMDIMRTLDTRGPLNIPAISRAVSVSSLLTGPVAAARRARRGLPF